jgi:hypothetical protein
MIGLVLGLLTFFFTDTGHFGGDIVNALGVVETVYYVFLFISGSIAAFMFLIINGACLTSMTSSTAEKVGMSIAGVTLSSFVVGMMLFKIVVQLMLVNWLLTDIDVMSDDLSTKQIFGLLFLTILAFFNRGHSE